MLNEYWNNFCAPVAAWKGEVNAIANTQPKSVFSFRLTVMDEVLAWAWDQERDRVPICCMCVDLHKSSTVRSTHAAMNGDQPGWKTQA